jgi:hypothetical protein
MLKIPYNTMHRKTIGSRLFKWTTLVLLSLMSFVLACAFLRPPPDICIWASRNQYIQLMGYGGELWLSIEEPRASQMPPGTVERNEIPYTQYAVRRSHWRFGIFHIWTGDVYANQHLYVRLFAAPTWILLIISIIAFGGFFVKWRKSL